jgi:RHS repeat-associated protein
LGGQGTVLPNYLLTAAVGDRWARYLRIYGTQRGTQWGYSLWEIEAVRSNVRNAALRTVATALTSGTTAGSAVDGSAATGWVSSAADNEWWQTDLGAPRWMNRMTLRWGGCYGVDYKIKASLDGRTWKTLHQTASGDGGVDEATFASVRARYVRWEGTRRSGSGGYDLRELEVYGPEIRAWASSEGASLPAAHAVDGDPGTRWGGAATDPQWIAVDFGETRAFDTVRVAWEAAYGKDYLVQVSTDQLNWTIVGAVTGGGGGVEETAVGPQAARYLRVYGLARGTPWGYSLYEIDAYGAAEPVEDPLVGNYAEGTATGDLAGLTDIVAIRAAIQANKNRVLKDANGNMIIARDKWIAYDYDNRPVKVVTEDGTLTTLAYDHEGQRTQQKVYAAGTSTPTVSTYIGTVYEEKGVERIRYIHAGGQRIARVSTVQGTGYFHTDHLGSTGLLTSGAGSVAGSWSYLPFGGTFKAEGTGGTDWRYTGQRQDEGSGLYYYNARYYDPTLGRFITPDTLIADPYNPQNLNRYSYVENNPVNFTDPTGNWKLRNFLKSAVQFATVAAAIYLGPTAGIEAYALLGAGGAAATTALTKGSSFGDVVQSGVAGFYAGGAGGLMGKTIGGFVGDAVSRGFGAGVGGFAGAVTSGAAGGYAAGASAAFMYGGNNGQIHRMGLRGAGYGAAIAGAGKLMEYAYNAVVLYSPDGRPGDGYVAKGKMGPPVKGKNNVGFQGGEANILPGETYMPTGLYEGGGGSELLNSVPGINATAGMHDMFQISLGDGFWRNSLFSQLTVNPAGMIVAAAMTYPTLLAGPQSSSALISDYFIDQEVRK